MTGRGISKATEMRIQSEDTESNLATMQLRCGKQMNGRAQKERGKEANFITRPAGGGEIGDLFNGTEGKKGAGRPAGGGARAGSEGEAERGADRDGGRSAF